MTDWTGGGAAALDRLTPEVAKAFEALVAMRSPDVTDALTVDPAYVAFAEQFGADVSVIDDELRARFTEATGAALFTATQLVWVADVTPRLRAALDALFGAHGWPAPTPRAVDETWGLVDRLMVEVARLDALDPTLTELVRLRGARQHDCRLCASRRSVAAIEQGADEVTFDAVDRYADSDLPAATKAALGLVDAMIWTPTAIPADVVDAVRRELSPAQAVEVACDVARNAANKIAVALRADAAEVPDGVQLFTTDANGTLTTVP